MADSSLPTPVAQDRQGATARLRRRRSWWELFLQFFAVALGVAAATGVGTWREQRSLQELERRALQGIANEIAINHERLKWRRDYYTAVVTEISELQQQKGAQATTADLKQFRGLNPILLRRSAFEVSQQSGAFGRLDFATAERTADLYALQDWVLGGVGKWMDYIVQHSSGMILPLTELKMIMRDWTSMCDELLRAYAAIQPSLPKAHPVRVESDTR